jgi:adenine phosphoribosyltransferase
MITLDDVAKSIRDVQDFPIKGILFKDITTAIKDKEIFNFVVDQLYDYYKDKGITKVVGIESRGFIFGSALAYRLNAGFVPVRKPGKLPADIYSKSYSLEYGENTINIHKDALSIDDKVLLHDDLLATGGSSLAALELIEIFNVKSIYVNFFVELSFLAGRRKLSDKYDIYSLIKF